MTKFRYRTIVFPRWNEDIATERRTVLHLSTEAVGAFAIGDRLIVVPSATTIGKRATIVEVNQARLAECLAGDLALLGLGPADAEAYHTRWDRTNPKHPLSSDPMIWRIVFRYDQGDVDDPPEWSLAA